MSTVINRRWRKRISLNYWLIHAEINLMRLHAWRWWLRTSEGFKIFAIMAAIFVVYLTLIINATTAF